MNEKDANDTMTQTLLAEILAITGTEPETAGHVIWDWNGTLLNDVDHAIAIMNQLLAEHGKAPLDRDRYQEIFEFPVRKYYDALGFDYQRESFESLAHKFVDRFMAGFKELPLIEEMEPLLREINKMGLKQSVLSATDQDSLDGMISHYGLNDLFHGVFGINDKLAASKVARGEDLLRLSGSDRAKTVIVGDTLHDLEVGMELGIQAILVGHGHQSPTRLRAKHSRVVTQV